MDCSYLCSENKEADQVRGYRDADLRLCFRICKIRFSHDAAHIKLCTHKPLHKLYFGTFAFSLVGKTRCVNGNVLSRAL